MRFYVLTFLLFKVTITNAEDCNSNQAMLNSALPKIDLSLLAFQTPTETRFCVDAKTYDSKNKEQKELLESYKLLDSLNVFDEKSCIKEEAKLGVHSTLIASFIKQNLEVMPINVVVNQVDNANKSEELKIHYAVSSLNDFTKKSNRELDTKLSAKDKWQLAGVTTSGIVVGALVSEKLYKGQEDKRKHWMVGAVASGVTSGATYFLLEEAGLGDKLGLSKKQKKYAIALSGPIMGTILGIAKEVYDSHYPKKHTVDKHDALATSLGGGLVIPLVVNFAF